MHVVFDFDNGPGGVQNAEKHHCADLDGHVVLGYDILRGNLECFHAQRDPNNPVDRTEHEDQSGALGSGQQAP